MIRVILVAIHVLLAVYLLKGVQATTISYFNGATPNVTTYRSFINTLRSQLTSGAAAHGFPLLRRSAEVPVSQRFILVELVSGDLKNVTIPIDVVNANVLGFFMGNNFLYFTNTPLEAVKNLFPGSFRRSLEYGNDYGALEKQAFSGRGEVPIGHSALNNAINRGLSYPARQGKALLAIIQMTSEAARIRYIERLIRQSMKINVDIVPDAKALSMEDKWSDLSKQIQLSGSAGVFPQVVEVRGISNQIVRIRNAQEVLRGASIALLLYHCSSGSSSNALMTTSNSIIRMPVDVSGKLEYGEDNELCPVFEAMQNIIGPEEMCVDVSDVKFHNGNPVILWPCGVNVDPRIIQDVKPNQEWTLKSDGTIQCKGKCLTASGYKAGDSVVIHDCDKVKSDTTKWALTDDGTITNPASGLVLTTSNTKSGSNLTLALDSKSPWQAWKAGNYTDPIQISYIRGFSELCMQAYNDNTRVFIEECRIGEKTQQWALYSDSTIRVYSNRNLCVTSDGHNQMDVIIILKCQGWGNQRWRFMPDGTILNPNAGLVMDVRNNDLSKRQILLYKKWWSIEENQQWLAFF